MHFLINYTDDFSQIVRPDAQPWRYRYMKIIFKRSLILALTLTMVLSMCGCRSLRKKVADKEYVENIMDVNFKGIFN